MARFRCHLASRSAALSSTGRLTNAPTWNSRITHSSPRRALAVAGTVACSHFSGPAMSRSMRGMIHGGVRCTTVSFATSGWMDGTIWMAEAPVPIMATRLPRRS